MNISTQTDVNLQAMCDALRFSNKMNTNTSERDKFRLKIVIRKLHGLLCQRKCCEQTTVKRETVDDGYPACSTNKMVSYYLEYSSKRKERYS